MGNLLYAVMTQLVLFLPLAIGVNISYTVLRATDMTLDGSFVLGAAVFAKLTTVGLPPFLSAILALLSGSMAGVMVSLIQRGGKIDPLLAGIIAAFILVSLNLIIMGRPNISLLSTPTLVSSAFNRSDLYGYTVTGIYCLCICFIAAIILKTKFGLILRALGDNPALLKRLGKPLELYRTLGFAFTNTLSAASGILTAQVVGYADTSMGLGMTLTGIGAIILGQQALKIFTKSRSIRELGELGACLIGSSIYFFAMNMLLRMNIDPVYLKMILGLVLIVFLRAALRPVKQENPT
jgi:putative ABC transport system permease protein